MKKLLLLILLIPSMCFADPVDIKYNTASQCAPIIVTNSNDELQSAVTASSVTVSIKEGITGTWADLTLTDACTNAANTWCEEDAVKAKGVYRACLATTAVDTKGKLFYAVRGASIKTRFFSVPVTTYTADEESDKLPASGTMPNTTTQMLVSPGTGTGQISLTSGRVGINLDDTAGTLSPTEVPALGDLKWGTYEVVDLTNEGGDANPTVTSFDTNLTWTSNFTNTTPQPIIYFPTTTEESTQNSNCNVQGMRTTATNYNTTTKVVTINALPLAPDYRCVFRIY